MVISRVVNYPIGLKLTQVVSLISYNAQNTTCNRLSNQYLAVLLVKLEAAVYLIGSNSKQLCFSLVKKKCLETVSPHWLLLQVSGDGKHPARRDWRK
jgi:hypothetical protein